MRRIFKPISILLFITASQLISIAYFALFSEASDINFFIRPLIIAVLLLSLSFAVYALIKRKEDSISTKIHIGISVVYLMLVTWAGFFQGFEVSYLNYSKNALSPWLVFVLACLTAIVYSILGIAYNTTPPDKQYKMTDYLKQLIVVPFIGLLGANLLLGSNSNTIFMIIIFVSLYAVVFLITKMLFMSRKNESLPLDTPPGNKYYILTFIIALCLPLCGLTLNQNFFSSDIDSPGMFGDFSSPVFYIIAALNGLLLLISPVGNKNLRILMFYLKSVGYTYILYFFIVFLPVTHFAILGIFFYGLGILALTPLMVTVLQGFHLLQEWTFLSKSWGKKQLAAVFCIGIITLPVCVSAVFWGDRENYTMAAKYLEKDNYHESKPVNLTKLQRTLKFIKGGLQSTRAGEELTFYSGNIPIISGFYTNFILDNKLISNENTLKLENLFFDAGHDMSDTNLSDPDIVNNNVTLLAAGSETRFDEKSGVFKTWVNLKLENASSKENGEYKTTFKLPAGAYISNYYLNVSGARKEGILADRRAALFIYRKIVNTRRDPGLLHYIGKNTLELRVFPFSAHEVRETGFEIIHSQKFDLTLDDKIISINGDNEQKLINVDGAVLLPASQKANLKSCVRQPKYYFVIDSSKNSDVAWHISQVQEYAKVNKIYNADVIFASYKLTQKTLANIQQAKYKAECGFNLNTAVNMILNKVSNDSKNKFPIIIAVSDNMPGAILPNNVSSLSGRFPECHYYYSLNNNLTLTPYSYDDNKAGSAVNTPVIQPILDYNGTYIPNNGQNELILTKSKIDKLALTHNQYNDAILLDATQQKDLLEPGKTDSLELVRASFRSRILTPQTAFIVVENQEQEKELLDIQERILTNNEATPTVTLDEPSWIIYVILVLMIVCIAKRKALYDSIKNFHGKI